MKVSEIKKQNNYHVVAQKYIQCVKCEKCKGSWLAWRSPKKRYYCTLHRMFISVSKHGTCDKAESV